MSAGNWLPVIKSNDCYYLCNAKLGINFNANINLNHSL